MRTGMNLNWAKWVIGLTMLTIFLGLTLPSFIDLVESQPAPEQESITLEGEPIEQEYIDLAEWENLRNQGLLTHYDVDVWIPTGHAWQRHGDAEASAALRSVNENGTEMVLSERNGNLHLLTRNEKGEEFVVVINRITKSTDPYRNNSSVLNTAWKLKNGATIGSYFQEVVVNGRVAKLVRLRFSPGEVFFTPHKG